MARLRGLSALLVVLGLTCRPTDAGAQVPGSAPPAQDEHQHDVAADTGANTTSPILSLASGTAWLPSETPMHAVHYTAGAWQVMLHGNLFVQYLMDQDPRGHEQFGSINWLMAMADRSVGTGRLMLSGMASLERWTVGACGYPDLLATGETCRGAPLHDRQHPHDFFMELAARYDRPAGSHLRWQVYAALAGEPALGPPAYPHRVSSMPNPLAPIAHHWLDATHISFGVVSGGLYTTKWKAEASVFNGREPDEHRWDLDLAALDSYSARIWLRPTDRLALQVSAGHLEDAEPEASGEDAVDTFRLTASAIYHRRLDDRTLLALTAAWGRNSESGEATNMWLAEAAISDDRNAWFGRGEIGQKTSDDLVVSLHDRFGVGKLQAGYIRYFPSQWALTPGLGAIASLSMVPNNLQSFYGQRATFGAGLFMTLRPRAAGEDPHTGHQMSSRR